MEDLGKMIGLVVLLFVIANIAAFRQSRLNVQMMQEWGLKLSERMWLKMNSLEWLIFHGKNRVYFFDMLLADFWRFRQGMMAVLEIILVNLVIVGALTLLICWVSIPMFILCVFALVLIGGMHFYSNYRLKPYFRKFSQAWRTQHYWIANTIDQFDLLRMDRAFTETQQRHRENTQTFLGINTEMYIKQAYWKSVNQVVGNLVRVVIFIIGLFWIQINYITLTDFFFVLFLVSIIQNNISQVPGGIFTFMEGQESVLIIREFFSLPEEKDISVSHEVPVLQSISIGHLSYAYSGKEVLSERNLNLEKGKIYLWRGNNGSGKSTMAHILLGFLQPQNGSLSINGKAQEWNILRQFRNRFAFVHQDAPMFTGSIDENILFGHPQPEKAADMLQNSWLYRLLPLGENPGKRMIGERGEGLSGGEARRLALVREWLRSSELIILDEPLNHLDQFAIQEITKEIIGFKNTAIVVIISHQDGFEKIADEIIDF